MRKRSHRSGGRTSLSSFIGISLVSALLSTTSASEAVVSLEGTVTEANSEVRLSGASLVVKNTFTGTVAGDEGKFVLVVESLPVTLMVSYIGYQTAEIEVAKNTPLAIELEEVSLEADEMIVVGSRSFRAR